MIKVIGAKRTSILVGLAVLGAVLAALVYMVMIPQNEALETQVRQTTGKVSSAKSHTEQMRTQMDVIQHQKADFGKLQATEFFTPQDRVTARDRLAAMQKYSHVLLATYDIKAAEVQRTDDLTAAGHMMLNTPVTVKVNALDDMDFYNFVYLVQNAFPGYVGIQHVEINRVHELDEVALREIGSGTPTVMINGTMDFEWKTIVPDTQFKAGNAQAGM